MKYEDATELYQEDATKSADRAFDGLVEVIENVGPSNVTAVTLDNAPVMLAAMGLLQIRYEFLFCLGCLAHKVNTLVKHLIKDDDMNDIFEIVEKTKKIVMAKKIFLVSIANEAAELNWKQYKDNSTKNRSALLPDKVHKLICIQAAATLREHQLNGFKYEAAKWTIDDEVCKLSKQVEMSRDNIIVKFLNYQEDWEEDKIRTKNRAHESLLNDKYQHVYLYDSDTQETRRILHVEWSTAHRPAKYAVVTQFVHGIHENEEDDLVSYYINESLFDCIRAAPLPYNQQRRLIERPN